MNLHRFLAGLSLLLIGIYAAPVAAQPGEPAEPGPRTKAPKDGKRGERPRRRGGRRGRDAAAQMQKLNSALELNETQQKEIEELLTAHQAKVREIRDEHRPSAEDRETWRELRDDMKRAREEGDMELMEECRKRMRASREAQYERMRPAREAIEAAEKKLHDEIVAKLDDNQKASFEDIWGEVMDPGRSRGNRKYDPRLLERVVMRVEGLTSEQETKIESLFEEFKKARPDRRRGRDAKPEGEGEDNAGPDRKRDRRGRRGGRGMRDDAAGKKLYDDVMAVLTEDQRKEAEATLEKAAGKRGKRGERGPRGRRGDKDDRDGPGRFRDPEDRSDDADEPSDDS